MGTFEEDCSLARRILRDLRIIFEREPNLWVQKHCSLANITQFTSLSCSLEFDIIPIEDKICNKSPVILQDHRLALESWSIKHLYQYTYHQFIESRSNNIRRGELLCNFCCWWTRYFTHWKLCFLRSLCLSACCLNVNLPILWVYAPNSS